MKKLKVLIAIFVLGLGFYYSSPGYAQDTGGSSDPNIIDALQGKIDRCYAKLHTCFREGDLDNIFAVLPSSPRDCSNTCLNQMDPGNENACSYEECVSRCEVAFELALPPCE